MAENSFEFEHRDLHWGNILVRECSDTIQEFILDGELHQVESHNVKATIIDFSLSRFVLYTVSISAGVNWSLSRAVFISINNFTLSEVIS